MSMIDEPKPTTPPSVPAISPTASTSTYSMHARRAKAASVAGRGEAAARHREACARAQADRTSKLTRSFAVS
jgi:hypothetical protein